MEPRIISLIFHEYVLISVKIGGPMIIYIYGEDTFRSRVYLKQQVERFKKERDPQGMNVVFLDGQKDGDRIWSEILATPFLAEKRMIIIQNVLSTKDTGTLESLVEGIKNREILPILPPQNRASAIATRVTIGTENNVVIFYQSEPLGKTKICAELAKILAKEKWAMQFENLIGPKLAVWIKEEAAKRGGAVETVAINYLCQNVGQDMWYLNSLLDQLVAYSDKKETTLADVQLFLEEKVDDNIFNMADAVVSGNRKLAFKLVQEQRRLGGEEGYLFGMIARQFRILLTMRDLFNRQENISSDQMAKMLGLHPFVVKKSLPLIKRHSLDKLKQAYDGLLDIDIKTKTGQADQSLLIDLFVGKLSS